MACFFLKFLIWTILLGVGIFVNGLLLYLLWATLTGRFDISGRRRRSRH